MPDPVHICKIRIVPEKRTVKQAYVAPFPEPIRTTARRSCARSS